MAAQPLVSGTIRASALMASRRLDAYYHLSEAAAITDAYESSVAAGFVDLGSLGRIWAPKRFKREYASDAEDRIGYLRPYDLFRYFPQPADWLSVSRTDDLDRLRVTDGMLLQSCSGRNLGPLAYGDSYLSQFALSHDAVRIEIDDELTRFFVYVFLRSRYGQAGLRRGKSGSVIDHIEPEHLTGVKVPDPQRYINAACLGDVERAIAMRANARLSLQSLMARVDQWNEPGEAETLQAWATRRSAFAGRLDAAPYSPVVQSAKEWLRGREHWQLRDVALALKPPGRYKTVYVSQAHGTPMMSGAQLGQTDPVALKYFAVNRLSGAKAYALKPGMVIYPADGRAEEGLGTPVLVTASRSGWLASGHVGRLVAIGITPGQLYLAFASRAAQVQLKALASGSVVDATFPEDARSLILPAVSQEMGVAAEQAWDALDEAIRLESQAIEQIEQSVARNLQIGP
jgi:hypothetical protein